MDQYISEFPKIVADREKELVMRSNVYQNDVLSRGELGRIIFDGQDTLSDSQRLSLVCRSISAESVSLVNKDGKVLETTGPVIPSDQYKDLIQRLEPRTADFEISPILTEEGEETGKKDGKAYVKIPVDEPSERSLVYEFSCAPLFEVYNTLGDWSSVLERTLSGLNCLAFVKTTEGDLTSYPLDGFTDEEVERLQSDALKIFQQSGRFLSWGNKTSCKPVRLLGQPSMAMLLPCPEQEADILMVMPLSEFMLTSVFSAASLSIFIVFGLILFQIYVLRLASQQISKDEREHREDRQDREAFRERLLQSMRPGRLLFVMTACCFSLMLLLLESRSIIAFIGMSKRSAVQSEIEWHQKQEGIIRSSYTDIYLTRTKAMADYLTENETYRTRGGLKELCNESNAEYLMLFDAKGQELASSNSYTGFSVAGKDANLSEEYKAVLFGYPSVVVGPKKDPYSGQTQLGVAVLLMRDDGQADGFLLAVFGAGELQSELDSVSLENTVNTFVVAEGYKVAVVNNEDGLILAHTDSKKIGQNIANYLPEGVYGDDFEGFTDYGGKDTYVSGVSSDGRTLMFLVPNRPNSDVAFLAILMIVALLIVLAFFYCPRACVLCAKALDESLADGDEVPVHVDRKNPLSVFAYGYVLFFTIMALVTVTATYKECLPTFAFIFNGRWSRGVHLVSLWAVLFFVSVTLFLTFWVRSTLKHMESRLGARSMTVLRLVDSFIAYATGLALLFHSLYIFGVDTKALLASAGIVSIAVGMGAKDMIADVLAGLFMAVEDSIHMGDVVSVKSWKGCVTDMGIRTTRIMDDSQNVMILNNSHINDVVNMSQQKTVCSLELALNRNGSMAHTEQRLGQVLDAASEEFPELHGSLKLEGICNISQDGFSARLSYECAEAVRESVTKQVQEFIEKKMTVEKEEQS